MTPDEPARAAHLDLPVTLLRVSMFPVRPWRVPPYAGVTLRGAIGHAFRMRHCTEPDRPQCKGCPRLEDCVVPGWFDPGLRGSSDARPIALRVVRGGSVGLDRPIVIVLAVLGEVPAPARFLAAIRDAGASGLGGERVPHHAGPIEVTGERRVLAEPGENIDWPAPARLSDLLDHPEHPTRCVVRFRSPFRWSKERPSEVGISADLLFKAALARLRGAQRLLGLPAHPRFGSPGDVRVVRQDLRWFDGGRRSRRQEFNWVWLGGVVGRVMLEGDLAALAPLLAAAEVLQLGRATSAGLGAISVDWQ